jgi:prolyl-tRNA synthetase
METAEEIYLQLSNNGVEALLDDRDSTPGVKFKDADLIGIPLRLTIGEKNLKKELIEIRRRKNGETTLIKKDKVAEAVSALIREEIESSLQA